MLRKFLLMSVAAAALGLAAASAATRSADPDVPAVRGLVYR